MVNNSNSVIIHGVQIGKFAKVGTSSLVNKNVADFTFVRGVPAKEKNNK